MDSTILQLFSVDEILDQLGRKSSTGCLHVFTTKDSANVFLQDGLIVHAVYGPEEGLEILRQILTWEEPRCLWQADSPAPETGQQPLQLPVQEFLSQQKPATNASAAFNRKSFIGVTDASSLSEGAHPLTLISAQGATTGPLNVDLTATKTINPTGEDRAEKDAALLKRHPLVVVSMENPEKRYPIKRVSSVVGRNPACDIPISHPSISRQHCLLQLTDRGLHIKDLGTTNGTAVNGITLKEGYINAGDKLTIGHVKFVLEKA